MRSLPEYFTLKVKKVHIEQGICGDAGNCPIALSLYDHLGEGYDVSVTINGPITLFRHDDPSVKWVFQDEGWVNTWAGLFDEGADVKPVEIDFQFQYTETEDDVTIHYGDAEIYDTSETIWVYDEFHDDM